MHLVHGFGRSTFFASGCPSLVSSHPHCKELFLFLSKMPSAWLDQAHSAVSPILDGVSSPPLSHRTRGGRGSQLLSAGSSALTCLVPSGSWGWGWGSMRLVCPAQGLETRDVRLNCQQSRFTAVPEQALNTDEPRSCEPAHAVLRRSDQK